MLEISALAALSAVYLMTDPLASEQDLRVLNFGGPLALAAILIFYGWRLIKIDGRYAWTALFWFRMATAAYFGVGTALTYVMSHETRSYVEAFYHFSEAEVMKLNAVVAVSSATVLGVASVLIRMFSRRSGHAQLSPEQEAAAARWMFLLGSAFLTIGLLVGYLLHYPARMGYIPFEVPSAIMNLQRFSLVGIFLLTAWSLQHRRSFLPFITLIAATEMMGQLLMFAKAGTLFVLLMYALAILWRRVTLLRVVVCAAAVIGTYAFLQQVVAFARAEQEIRHGIETRIGFTERLDIIGAYFSEANEPENRSGGTGVQSELSRMNYVNAATLVISQYDAGSPADWPERVPAVFVPRLLWPEKPIITDIGLDIYELGTGRRNSSSGASVFADSYWAMGWSGVVFYMAIYGAILGLLSVFAWSFLRAGKWVYFPFIVMGLQLGVRVDGHYISDVAGGSVIAFGMLACMWVAEGALGLFLAHFRPRRRERSLRGA